jgi:CBS domain-containing protein
MVSTISKTERGLVLDVQVAAELMVPDPISIRAEASAAEAMTMFTEKGITAAPVIDEAGRPIGVLSRSDLLVHETQNAKRRAGEPDYFYAPTFETEEDSGTPKSRATVTELMTPAVFAVSPSTPLQRVVSDMVGLHVHRLFVVDEAGVLIGVISAMDVLRRLRPA